MSASGRPFQQASNNADRRTATQADRRLAALFEEAEAERRCLTRPKSNSNYRALRRRLTPAILSPMRGMYARRDYWEHLSKEEQSLHIARALHMLNPSWVFCGPTAAVAHGLETPRTLLTEVYVASNAHSTSSGRGLRRLSTDTGGAIITQGIPVTNPLITIADCLRISTFPEGLAIADSALVKLGLSAAELELEIERLVHRKHGSSNARNAVHHASDLSENGGESYARGVMIEEGFRTPHLQVEIPDPLEPGSVFRVDYFWQLEDGTTIIGELDGKDKLVDDRMLNGMSAADALRKERTRESRLSMTGAKILRFSFRDVLDRRRFVHTLEAFGIPRAKRNARPRLP